jgi:GNAT superfamily N-acetyltransferase
MTTTIRPVTPEAELPGGGRGRSYAIMVNGRRVGGLNVSLHGGSVPGVGEISHLTVAPSDRRRGRATVAALAAEEVLRSWGCARITVNVPDGPDEEAALGLARMLGYTLRARNMRKELPDTPPALPPGSTGRPLRPEEFGDWVAVSEAGYAAEQVTSGLTPEQGLAKARADLAAALPHGLDTPDTVLRRLEAGGAGVGSLWVCTRVVEDPDRAPSAWVFDVLVDEPHRGRGHGRTLMLLAERECLARGVHRLGLNVFADNAPANALYRSLGYRTFRHVLHKQL